MDQHEAQHEAPQGTESHHHSSRALSFGAAAQLYDQSRPNYPAEMFRWALSALPTEPHVLDLGAGTGKLTASLLSFTDNVVAVEPDPGMRSQFSSVLPKVQVLDGKDSAIPLPDQSVDAVFVGQAWHWFDEEAAGAEIFRVLRPGGVLVVAWNTKDDSKGWVRDFCQLIDTGSVVSLPRPEPRVSWAAPEPKDFLWDWHRSVGQLVDYTLSTSGTLTASETERESSRVRIQSFLESVPNSQAGLDLPFVTQATKFRRPAIKPTMEPA